MRDIPNARPPVVLQVLPGLETGGVERGTIEIAQALGRAGWMPLVASSGGRLVPAVARAGGRHFTLPLATKNPLRIWRNAGRLSALIRAQGVDIVHARSRAPAWSAWLAARRAGVHFITTFHNVYGEQVPLKHQYNAVMAKGEIVIAISHFVARTLIARHAVDPGRVRVIPRGADLSQFDPDTVAPDRLARLTQAWRLPDGRPTILLPGRLTRWKGQGVLIEALAKLARPEVVCVLVGADQGRARYTKQLLARAAALGVAGQLRIVGHCDDMPAALMLSDVVVNASIEPEGFGRVVVEAQAMGRPVIATDHGGAMETIDPGATGWRVPPGDADALAVTLAYVLDLPEADRAALGAQARTAVAADFTIAAMQQATFAVYREVLGMPPEPRAG